MDSFGELGPALAALVQVLLIDLVLAGDNAVAVGLAAGGLPDQQRRRAILVGLGAAVVLRIGFALIATYLLGVIGLLLAGGLLLLWVCWKMWRELREHAQHDKAEAERAIEAAAEGRPAPGAPVARPKSFRSAVTQILIADVSMSLDNVLAVAGAAREHPGVLVFGLLLSIALMGLAASFIAKLLNRYRWIGYLGLAIVFYVAMHMVWEGHRSVVVRTGSVASYNQPLPAPLDISAHELEEGCRGEVPARQPACLAQRR